MKKIVKYIADGDLGIDQTVSEMWRLLNRDSKDSLVIDTAKSLQKADKIDTVKAIYDYVWHKVPYVPDPLDTEHLTAPIFLINGSRIGEDCDGMVMLLGALLQSVGYKVRIRTLAWRIHEFTHVVLDVKLDGKWIGLDATRKSLGYDFKMKIIREKIYNNPMNKLTTLEDDLSSNCGCKKKSPMNQNIINIGNSNTEKFDDSDYLNFDYKENSKAKNDRFIEPQIIEKEKIVEVPVERIIEKPILKKVPVDRPVMFIQSNKRFKNYPSFY